MAAAAGASLKPRVIGASWAAVAGVGGYVVHRHIRDFEEKTPCVQDALRVLDGSRAARAALGGGDLLIARWPRQASVDAAAGLARARFEVRGEAGALDIVVGARRRAHAQRAYEQALEEEEEEEQLKGWRRYFYRPWELKPLLLGAFRRGGGAKAGGEEEEEEEDAAWELDALFFLPAGDVRGQVGDPTVLVGDPRALPEHEALCGRRDILAKGEYSRKRLRVFVGLAVGAAVIAGGARLVKSLRTSQTYGYVKRALQAHPQVAGALGPGARVLSSSGTFGARYINARLRLAGAGGAVADVEVAATRDGPGGQVGGPWRVASAKMNTGGLTHHLDRAAF